MGLVRRCCMALVWRRVLVELKMRLRIVMLMRMRRRIVGAWLDVIHGLYVFYDVDVIGYIVLLKRGIKRIILLRRLRR